MKPNKSLRSFLALSGTALLAMSSAEAAWYYWDANGTAAGFGNTAGTWGSSAFIGVMSAPNGRGILDGTLSTAATATATGDTISFGTINLALSGAATTVTVSGTQNIGNITFGLAQTNAMTLTGGTINFAAAGTIYALAPNTIQTIESNISGAATSLTKGGQGTLVLTGTNTYAGTTIITSGGMLQLGNGGTAGSLNGSTGTALTFNSGGGIFNFAKADTSSQNMGALTFTAGEGTVRTTAASGSASQTLTFASLAARAAGATANFELATNLTASQNKITLTSTTNAPVSGSGSNNQGYFFNGTEYARYDTINGYFRAVDYGTDNNASAIIGTGATLGINDATKDVKISGNITAQDSASVNTLNLASNSLTFQDTASTFDVNGILSTGSASAVVANGASASSLRATTSGGELVIRVNGSSDQLTIAPNIVDNTTASALTKSGAGTLVLSGANTYTGITRINTGTLALSGGSALADTASVVLADTAGVTLKLNSNETIGNVSGGGYSGGDVNVQGNTLTLSDNTSQTFGGKFIGTSGGVITKNGSGTLTLTNQNAFLGAFNLNAGSLSLTLGNSGTTLLQTISSGGAINMAGGTTFGLFPANQVALGQHTANSPSQLTVAGASYVVSNNFTITSGIATFRLSGNGNRANYTGTITGGTTGSQTLNILQGYNLPSASGDSQSILFSGIIQNGSGGTLGVTVDYTNSSGTAQTAFINLSGQNTFTGNIAVSNTRGLTSGAYFVIGGERTTNNATTGVTAGAGSLGTSAPGTGSYAGSISIATGTILNYASSANQTLSGDISGAGQLLKDGAGTLTLTGNNTFTGNTIHTLITTATTIRAGTLSVGSLDYVTSGTYSNHGLGSNLGAPTTVAAGTIAIGNTTTGAQLTYTGTGETTDRVINLAGTTGGATIDQSGASGLLKFTSNLTATGAGIKTLTLQGSTNGAGEISGAIVDNSGTNKTSLTKLGTGTWTLSGSNSYTGATTVTGGKLAVNGSITSAVTVQTGATLQGSGSITGNVTVQNGGTLATGNSIESLAITGNLSQNAGSTFAFEINNDAALSAAGDLTAVNGNLTLGAGSLLALSELGSGVWGVTEKLTLLSYSGSLSGLFTYNSSTLADDSTFVFSGATWQFNYNDTVAGSNYSADLLGTNYVTMTVIPEPKAALLGALGVLLLLRRRRA